MMHAQSSAPRPSRTLLVIGWILTLLPAPLLVFSAVMKFLKTQDVVDGFAHLGMPDTLALPLGILELSCLVIYLIPRTAVLGAILLAGYMGGAMVAHIRIGEPFFTQAALGIVVWLGLYLREPRLHALIPFRNVG